MYCFVFQRQKVHRATTRMDARSAVGIAGLCVEGKQEKRRTTERRLHSNLVVSQPPANQTAVAVFLVSVYMRSCNGE
jgi:hypothetical protein